MGSATKLAQIEDVNSGVTIPHTSIVTRVGKTINADNLTMMPHGVTPPILTNDGKNVIAKKSYKFFADLKSNKLLFELINDFCQKIRI